MESSQPIESKTQSLVSKFATKYSVEPAKLLEILKKTVFKGKVNKKKDASTGEWSSTFEEVSNEQLAALLIVADQYQLNPFTKEIYAFPDKQNGIIPVVGIDGWLSIINRQPELNGITFTYSDNMVELNGARKCPEWIDCTIHRKDREYPIVIREWAEEVYKEPTLGYDKKPTSGPWQTHTKRMLRHKSLIQASRIAFGFSGIYDHDEAVNIYEHSDYENSKPGQLNSKEKAQEKLTNLLQNKTAPMHVSITEPADCIKVAPSYDPHPYKGDVISIAPELEKSWEGFTETEPTEKLDK